MQRWTSPLTTLLLAITALVGLEASAFAFVVKTSAIQDPNGPKIKNGTEDNYAYVPTTPAAGKPKLLLFLAGSGGSLGGYKMFMQFAADHGYYVIGLAYRNDYSHTDLCGCMPGCMGEMEEQNATGKEHHFYSKDETDGFTPQGNSIDYRLGRLVTYMKQNNSDGHHFEWTQFVDANGPVWSKIVVAGHSGGGNIATWILKNKAPIAALTFSAPNPELDVIQPPATMLDYTPWAISGTHGTCTIPPTPTLPDWITSGLGAHLFVYDDKLDHAYTTAWAGHDIPLVMAKIGLHELLFDDGGTPSGQWITRKTTSTNCAGPHNSNPHHDEPISDCAGTTPNGLPKHHGVWRYMLDAALALAP